MFNVPLAVGIMPHQVLGIVQYLLGLFCELVWS